MSQTLKLSAIVAVALVFTATCLSITFAGPAPLDSDVTRTGNSRQASPKVEQRPGSNGSAARPFSIRFKAVVGAKEFRCGEAYSGIGTAKSTITPTDFRFFVHNVRLLTESGVEVPLALSQDKRWQYRDLALLDFENGRGPCSNGSAVTRETVEGTAPDGKYAGVRFTLGVPFDLNHEDPLLQPSPLNLTHMHWVWNGGYKFLRLDLKSTGQPQGLAIHIGSTSCTPNTSMQAPPAECAHPNRAEVSLTGFNPEADFIAVDIGQLLADANVDANAEGTGPGCMAEPGDPDCAPVFRSLGLPFGNVAGGTQTVFRVEKGVKRVVATDPAYVWNLPSKFPVPRVPADNPMSEAKVELGRYLFYDTRLSVNGKVSCGTCHEQSRAFTDGKSLAIGATGQVHPRNSMTLGNVAYSPTLTWANPHLRDVERQLLIPLFGEDPVEMGLAGKEKRVLKTLRADQRYRAMFAAAYPGENDPFSVPNVARAIASFVRTLISGGSPYDTYRFGRVANGISVQAKRGEALFFSERLDCFHCHIGMNFSGPLVFEGLELEESEFHNNGLYNIDGKGGYPARNRGLFDVTGVPEDMGRFKTPSLRNLKFTAPYMHDGSLATLDDVIDHYEAGGRLTASGKLAGDGRANPYKNAFVKGFKLTPDERADLIAFLMTLTDEGFVTDPRFSSPFSKPEKISSAPKAK
ncbi:MAG: di-heme enzyme [Acidobacteria bacterium]|nr:di-heme enzyme [Acidobacteriota bacterium]